MNFQAQFWFSFFVVLSLFLFSNARELTNSSSTINHADTSLVPGKANEPLSVLQKHVMFFDRNKDGLIYPSETFDGFRAIGCGIALSTTASVFINQGLSAKTRPGEPFDPQFPIKVKNIQMGKHTSDSGIYDKDGGFVESKFEEMFQKHANTNPSAFTKDELIEFIKSNREPKDFKGWLAAFVEWRILFMLGKDENGLLQKETVRAVFDGSLFDQLAAKKKANKA